MFSRICLISEQFTVCSQLLISYFDSTYIYIFPLHNAEFYGHSSFDGFKYNVEIILPVWQPLLQVIIAIWRIVVVVLAVVFVLNVSTEQVAVDLYSFKIGFFD